MSPRFDPSSSPTTREHILDSAARVMHTLGLARATTKEIASAAGLSEAALYRYFSDKAELFLCVIGERLPELVATLKDLPARVGTRTVRGNLEDVIRVALPFYDQTVPMAAAMFAEPELLRKHQAEMHRLGSGPHKANELLAAYFRAEQHAGRVSQRVDPDAAAALVVGACLGRVLLRRFAGRADSPEADERFARTVARTLLEGLAPEAEERRL